MYIEPNTDIYILHNVPLDNTFDHTIYFANVSAQTAYFQSKNKHHLTRQYYQRVERGYMNVNINAESLYDCNYLMFKNTAFADPAKWFYAFILNVEYVNNNVSRIRFQIDVMQTWHFNYTLNQCFVEREHSDSDNIGEHTLPENLDIGDRFLYNQHHSGSFDQYDIVIASTMTYDETDNLVDATGAIYSGVYSGVKFNVFSTAADANAFLNAVTQAAKSDSIVNIFMMPHAFVAQPDSASAITETETINKDWSWTYSSNGKSGPRNKKLYTYPFSCLYVTDSNGNSADYHYEYFSSQNCGFTIKSALSSSPEIMLYPNAYKGTQNNYNEKMVISDFPQCTFAIDSFKAWLAQNKARLIVDTSFDLMHAGQNIYNTWKNPKMDGVNKAFNTINQFESVANTMVSVYTASLMPPHAKGQSANVINTATRTQGFWFYNARVRDGYAEIIDDFFDRYGYACKRNKVPNRNVRPHWCYTKTIGCTITGSVPADDSAEICNIYNNGITWWKNGNEVGNYNLNNRV